MSASGDDAPAVLAVDGGNSKADLALVAADGRLLAAVRGPTISHQRIGFEAGADGLVALSAAARTRAGLASSGPASVAVLALAGADTPALTRRLQRVFETRGLAAETVVINDAFAPIHAGSTRGWGVGVICGAGVNAAGIAPDGRTARLAALGDISGDRGGGYDLGLWALGAAVRARDGRGPRTTLETMVPAHFGLSRPIDLALAIEHGREPAGRLRELAPVVFAAAAAGDAVARRLLDDLADEIVIMVGAIIRRLHMTRRDVEVTLAGGIFRADDPVLERRIVEGIARVAPAARVARLDAPPVLGAALVGLARLGGRNAAERSAAAARVRSQLIESAVVQLDR